MVDGKELKSGTTIVTKNALGEDKGKQILASSDEVKELMDHIKSYSSTSKDLRTPLRKIEQALLTKHSGFLVGNQCVDFQKQDGVTEIEEAIMANTIERKLNDMLLRDESNGQLSISRKPIYGRCCRDTFLLREIWLMRSVASFVSLSLPKSWFGQLSPLLLVSAVSNFTNFLDLFRKTIRNLEVGIPCIILGRSNTVQHSFRWTKLLMDLLIAEGVDPGMITYLSCSLDNIKHITQSCKDSTGNLYATCSRELASSIKRGYPNTVASTGGPNTLVTWNGSEIADGNNKKMKIDSWTDEVQNAIRCSATIESSGQCTALRHAVVPSSTTDEQIQSIFDTTQAIPNATKALEDSLFDGVFANHKGSVEPNDDSDGYTHHPTADAYYKIRDNSFPSTDKELHEFWRKVVVDVSRVDISDPSKIDELASWLNIHQPISLAINGPTRAEAMDIGLRLFEKTGLVVNTIGTKDTPALTCQARPQEAEVFGEFPPRKDLQTYTKYPVIVPSSTPSYDSSYTSSYLQEQAAKDVTKSRFMSSLTKDMTDESGRGYCVTLWEYLQDATQENPKRGFGSCRTAMWGLQRPPLGTTTYLRCDDSATWDSIAPYLVLFHGTNAKEQLQVSIPSGSATCGSLVETCQRHNIIHAVESNEEFLGRKLNAGDNVVNVEGVPTGTAADLPMVGQFVSRLFPVGHIKSTQPGDEEFVEHVKRSQKWLKMAG